MKFNKKYIVAFCGLFSLALVGCTEGFEDLNQDPNKITEVNKASAFLSPILYSTGSNNLENAKYFGNEIMQYAVRAMSESDGVHRYVFRNSTGSGYWSTAYSVLTNIEDMIRVAAVHEDVNNHAVALTMRAYTYSMLTDLFGDVPFSEANKGAEGIITPKFDKQEDIYTAILADLETASEEFDASESFDSSNDILFNGSVKKWERFCNSLQVRLLLRTSKVNTSAMDKLVSILENKPVFESVDDNATLRYTNVSPFDNPFLSDRFRDFSEDWGFSEFFIEGFKDMSDPRLEAWATYHDGIEGDYEGIPSGYKEDIKFVAGEMSSYQADFQSSSVICSFMTYSELCFIKAELALDGKIAGDANEYYMDGVKASMEHWQVEASDSYYEGIALSGTDDDKMQQIMLQKYYNSLFTDSQAWFEKRRTGYPELPLGEAVQNGGKMPNRMLYPTSVISYNEKNYREAISRMGGKDDINARVWW